MVYVHVYGFMAIAMLGLAILCSPHKKSYWSSVGAWPSFIIFLVFASILWPFWVALCTLEVMNDIKEMD